MPLFLIIDAEGRRVIERSGPVLTFGRSPDCTAVLPDRDLARIQFEIRAGDGGPWLADLSGGSGTRLNGRPVSLSHVNPGDRISAARTEIVFEPTSAELGTAGMAAAFAGGGSAGTGETGATTPGHATPAGRTEPESVAAAADAVDATPEPPRHRRRWFRWPLAGMAWGGVACAVAALYAVEEGSTFSIGPFVFRRGETGELNRTLLLCLGAVVVLHLVALCFWLAARRLSGPVAPGRPARGSGRTPPPGTGAS
jgi:hypothetical protein